MENRTYSSPPAPSRFEFFFVIIQTCKERLGFVGRIWKITLDKNSVEVAANKLISQQF